LTLIKWQATLGKKDLFPVRVATCEPDGLLANKAFTHPLGVVQTANTRFAIPLAVVETTQALSPDRPDRGLVGSKGFREGIRRGLAAK
jgi:hypothetical protein